MKKISYVLNSVYSYMIALWKENVIIIIFVIFILILNNWLAGHENLTYSFIVGVLASVLSSVFIRIAEKISIEYKVQTQILSMANEIVRCATDLYKGDSITTIVYIARIRQLQSEIPLLIDDMITARARKKTTCLFQCINKILCQISLIEQANDNMKQSLIEQFNVQITDLNSKLISLQSASH